VKQGSRLPEGQTNPQIKTSGSAPTMGITAIEPTVHTLPPTASPAWRRRRGGDDLTVALRPDQQSGMRAREVE
jgi:hypothetical protein